MHSRRKSAPRHQRTLAVSAVVLAMLPLSPAALAWCDGEWLPGEGALGIGGWLVYTSTTWDPDGEGPLEDWLVFCGEFDLAGNVLVNNIAAWDGQAFIRMGDGLNGPSYALVSHAGDLYAGGAYVDNDGLPDTPLYSWDGGTWKSVDTGLTGEIRALASYNGRLIIGGDLVVPGVGSVHLAAWDGVKWSAVGGGVSDTVHTFLVQEQELLVGGAFAYAGATRANGIAAWNGTTWRRFGSGIDLDEGNTVYALTVYNNVLYAGGHFETAGGATVNNIIRWNGTIWFPVGAGVTEPNPDIGVQTLEVYDGKLFVGGEFYDAGTTPALRLATWDGTSWGALPSAGLGYIFSIARYRDQLIVAGYSHPNDPQGYPRGIRAWDGERWQPMAEANPQDIHTMVEYEGELVVGGEFRFVQGQPMRCVASWNGERWRAYGGFGDEYRIVRALAVYQGQLIAGGTFLSDTNTLEPWIAVWEDESWRPLAQEFLPAPYYGSVNTLYVFDDDLIVGGLFQGMEGISANHIARWDGTSWGALGDGFLSPACYECGVRALVEHDGVLWAGGEYMRLASGNYFDGPKHWNGEEWANASRYGDIAFFDVRSLLSWRGRFFVGGQIVDFSAGGFGANIVELQGEDWIPLIQDMDGIVSTLLEYQGDLIAAGSFKSIDDVPANSIARYDGNAWHPLGRGLVGPVGSSGDGDTVAAYRGDLFVGGDFITAGSHVSANFAQWRSNLGDIDADGDVDLDDHTAFIDCLTGPDPGDLEIICDCADADGDNDTDLADFAMLQRRLTQD